MPVASSGPATSTSGPYVVVVVIIIVIVVTGEKEKEKLVVSRVKKNSKKKNIPKAQTMLEYPEAVRACAMCRYPRNLGTFLSSYCFLSFFGL